MIKIFVEGDNIIMVNDKGILEYVLSDETISFTAKGIFAFLLVNEIDEYDDPTFYILRRHSCESSKEINEALDELLERKYISRTELNEYEVDREGISKSISVMTDFIDDYFNNKE